MVSNFKSQGMPLPSFQVTQFSVKPTFSSFNFISCSRILPQFSSSSVPINRLHSLSLSSSPSPLSLSKISSNEHSFEVSYLMSTFGWPPEFAIVKSKNLRFNTPERPERMLDFLKKHGFTKTQISHIVKRELRFLLIVDPENTLLPKFEFLSSVGLSRIEITHLVTKVPFIFRRSLEKTFIPTFNLLRSLVNSDDEAVKIVKRYPAILIRYHEPDNIKTLLNLGVPAENIVKFMSYQREKLRSPTPDSFRKMVEEVKEMGFDPCTMNFLSALRVIKFTGKSTSEDKFQVLKKYGWSDRDILSALEKYPRFIRMSKEKIEGVLDFLVNTMGIEAIEVASFPSVICRSLEKSVIPRCLVYKSLLEKRLSEKKFSITTLLSFSEAKFFAKFIKPYEDEAPELLDLFKTSLPEPDFL